MLADPSCVIVEDGLCVCHSVPFKRIHHRDFPEIWVEAGTVAEGVARLADMLYLYQEGARSAWHRETLDLAIAEVAEFLDALLAGTGRSGEATCGFGAQISMQ